MSALERLLSADEQARIGRLRFQRDRGRGIVARAALRQVLARHVDLAPPALRFARGAHGKPRLLDRDRQGNEVHFNLSHSDGLGLVGVGSGIPVGIDIERLTPVGEIHDLAARFFSPVEAAAVRSADDPLRAFFLCWTRKEAYVKALGVGLSFPLSRFTVSIADGEPAAFLDLDGDNPAAWSVIDLEPKAGYVAALAVRAPEAAVSTWRWHPTLELAPMS